MPKDVHDALKGLRVREDQDVTPGRIAGDVASRMKEFRLRGNDEFNKGNTLVAVGLFTEGLQCMQRRGSRQVAQPHWFPVDSETEEEERVLLLTNRALAYGKLENWQASLDDADYATRTYGTFKEKPYARTVSALCGLLLTDAADQVLNFCLGRSIVTMSTFVFLEGKVAEVRPYDADAGRIADLAQGYLRNPSSSTFLVLTAGRVVVQAKSDQGMRSLRQLRGGGGLARIAKCLLDIEKEGSQELWHLNMVAAAEFYTCMCEVVKARQKAAAELFLDDKRIEQALSMAMRRRLGLKFSDMAIKEKAVTKFYMGLHEAQVSLIAAVAELWEPLKLLQALDVTPDTVDEWQADLWLLRKSMMEGRLHQATVLESIAISRLWAFLQSEREIRMSVASKNIAGLVDATEKVDPGPCIGLKGYFPRCILIRIFEMACRLWVSPRGFKEFLNAFGGGQVAEARLRQLGASWQNHPCEIIRFKCSTWMDMFVRHGLPRNGNEEVRSLMSLRRCDGKCIPRKLESRHGEFNDLNIAPHDGERTLYFCSPECLRECLPPSSGKEQQFARKVWAKGMESMRKGDLSGCTVAVLCDWWLPPDPSDLQEIASVVPVNKDPLCDIIYLWMTYLAMSREAEDKDPEKWLQDEQNVEIAKAVIMNSQFMVDFIMKPRARLSNLWRQHLDVDCSDENDDRADVEIAIKGCILLLELQSLVVLQLMWKDKSFGSLVMDMIRGWREKVKYSISFMPRTYVIRGMLYEMLAVVCGPGEPWECRECARVGREGAVACYEEMLRRTDVDDLWIGPGLRRLAEVGGRPELLIKAENTERINKLRWGDLEATFSRRVMAAKEGYVPSQQPARAPAGDSAKKQCAQCGVEKQSSADSKRRVSIKRCASCEAVGYCSPKCQKEHWPIHRQVCRSLRENATKGTHASQDARSVDKESSEREHCHDAFDDPPFDAADKKRSRVMSR